MRTPVAILTLVIVIGCPISIQAATAYNFEGLTAGSLFGQDNWAQLFPSFGDATVRNPTTGINLSKVASSPGTAVVLRKNNANWSFTPFTGSETNALMQFDGRYSSGSGVASFSLGFDANHDDVLEEQGPLFGIGNGNFFIRDAFGAGSPTNSTAPVGAAGSVGDWFQIQLRMNFTAFSGDGAGSFYYRNLTTGQTNFTPVATLQNVHLNLLGLNSVYNAPPNTWDTLVVALTSSYNEGTLLVPSLDNLLVGTVAVPEPNSFLLMLVGVSLLFVQRRSASGV